MKIKSLKASGNGLQHSTDEHDQQEPNTGAEHEPGHVFLEPRRRKQELKQIQGVIDVHGAKVTESEPRAGGDALWE